MDPLDPAVLEATGGASPEQVTKVTPHDVDPAWSVVEYADGRTETMPTSEASALPQLPPMGPPLPPPVGPGQPPAADPGFSLSPEQQAATSATPDNTLAFGGAGGDPVVPQAPGFGQMQTKAAPPGALPPPDPTVAGNPGAEVVAPGSAGGFAPSQTTETTGRTESEFAVDPRQAAANAQAEYGDLASGVQEREDYERDLEHRAFDAAEQQYQTELRRAEILTEESKKAVKIVEDTPIEEDFFKDAPGRQVAAWVALALSGFLQGATKGANPALNQMMQALNAAQDRFINNQRVDKTSKLALRREALGDAKAAEASMRMQMPGLIEKYARVHAQKLGMDDVVPGVSSAVASMRLKALDSQQSFAQHAIAQTERRLAEEQRATAGTGPVRRRDLELKNLLGPEAAKLHREAMDPKGANLGGLVEQASDVQKAYDVLEAIAAKNGGTLPQHEGLTLDRGDLGKLLARWGNRESLDARQSQALIEKIMLSVKQTMPIKSVDSEKEGEAYRLTLDTGTTPETLANLRQAVQDANARAVNAASGYTADPQGYIDIIRRDQTSTRGVAPKPRGAGSFGERVVEEAPAGASTGEAPATRPLAAAPRPEAKAPEASPVTGSRRGTYKRLRE